MAAATREELRMRELIWERIRGSITRSEDDPVFIDARSFAQQLLAEFPGSGLEAGMVAIEFHRIRRAMRGRCKSFGAERQGRSE